MTSPIYHAPDAADFAPRVEFDGFTLVYHRPSGQTHMLAEPAPEILDVLAQGKASPGEVLKRLASDHGIDSDDEADAVIAARMAELAALGLILAE